MGEKGTTIENLRLVRSSLISPKGPVPSMSESLEPSEERYRKLWIEQRKSLKKGIFGESLKASSDLIFWFFETRIKVEGMKCGQKVFRFVCCF